MKNITELTKKLISIPSWFDEQTNEVKIGEYIFKYLKNNSKLLVEKEMVVDTRFNILVGFNQNIRTLLIGHMDTVGINSNWQTNPIIPTVKNGKLFGRGATDMKSALAAMMLVSTDKNLPKGVAFLFYIDEEYNFAGVKKFIADYGSKIKPKSIISLDGSELEIANGCRGLIEISATIMGKSCHASRPENGVNALEVTFKSVEKLKKYLLKIYDSELGNTPLNLASITGGQAANVVPDICRFILDIRPSSPKVDAKLIVNQLEKYATKFGGKLSDYQVKFDFASWLTPKSKLEKLGLSFKDISTSGYIDIQMLWQIFGNPICLTIGAGAQQTAHSSNEYVEIEKLEKLPIILFDIIQKI